MKRRLLTALAFSLFALPAVPAGEPCCGAPCPPPPCEKTYSTFKLYWLERDAVKPKPPELKEHTDQEVKHSLELDWTEETRVRTETCLKPREIVKEVCETCLKPCKEIDPCTGCECIKMKEVTETRLVKEIVFDTVCEEKAYKVRMPYLKPTEKVVGCKRLSLECTGEMIPIKEKFGILAPCEVKERVVVPAQKPCQ